MASELNGNGDHAHQTTYGADVFATGPVTPSPHLASSGAQIDRPRGHALTIDSEPLIKVPCPNKRRG